MRKLFYHLIHFIRNLFICVKGRTDGSEKMRVLCLDRMLFIKIKRSYKCCLKLIEEVEIEIFNMEEKEIPSSVIGELVMEKLKNADMIIFDDIAPLDDFIGGISSFMVPESSVNHGFIQDNGKWLYLESVDGRNPDKEMPARKVRSREYYTP